MAGSAPRPWWRRTRCAGPRATGASRRYFFELTTSPNVVWVDLSRLDLAAGAPAMALDPDDIALSGEVSSAFEVVSSPF